MRRWRRVVRASCVAMLAAATFVVLLCVTVCTSPRLSRVSLDAPIVRSARDGQPGKPRHGRRLRAARQKSCETPRGRYERTRTSQPVVAAFYVNWQASSLQSLQRNVNHITHFMPEWLVLDKDGQHIRPLAADAEERCRMRQALELVRARRIPILPVLKNYDDGWDAARLHRLLRASRLHHAFAVELRDWLLTFRFQGVNVDFESVLHDDRNNLTHLMREIFAVLHAAGLTVTQDVEAVDVDDVGAYAFDLPALARWNDFVIYMAYDEHDETSDAGPIASSRWFDRQWRSALQEIPIEKLVLGIGNYAYDWTAKGTAAHTLTYAQAVMLAAARRGVVSMALGNAHYQYTDADGRPHEVWMLDAVSAFNQWSRASRDGPRGMALWCLGSEDPTVWSFVDPSRMRQCLHPELLRRVAFPFQIDLEGEGEIMQVTGLPREGRRGLEFDREQESITQARYQYLPSAYVVRRCGRLKKSVALTFDDGPDARFTPQILDVLSIYRVPATFFLVGRNAAQNTALVAREWNEGHELGNHTFTHPKMTAVSALRARLEVDTTQRVVENITGHSTLLFRPPYDANPAPRAADDLQSMLLCGAGPGGAYCTVGASIDPRDWDPTLRDDDDVREMAGRPRNSGDVVSLVLQGATRQHGNVVLLHDGGGDRSATVQALPLIIQGLQARGFRLVTVSELAGQPPRALNPPVPREEKPFVRFEGGVIAGYFCAVSVLRRLFFVAVAVGVGRFALLLALALLARRRESNRRYDPHHRPAVSVVIAAHNEAKVIARSLQALLDTRETVEVIVVDDGSSDGTGHEVAVRFGQDSRVRLLRQDNEGKARALSHALSHVSGEIVVSLDADTIVLQDTIDTLVRHFADPTVGAVAGNVRVGNCVNVLTRWQSMEYVTHQQFERRAYDWLNAIPVVPGAVGAWRRSALEGAGGYTSDTLAEDTDLTWRLLRRGWRLVAEPRATAFTEVPETLCALLRQRLRWTFGTLQCLWKHRDAVGRHGWFGRLVLPSLWVQMLFQILSPLAELWVLTSIALTVSATWTPATSWTGWAELPEMLVYYGAFVTIGLLSTRVAFSLERAKPAAWLSILLQRFTYRQIMMFVAVRALLCAVRGHAVGWDKLHRRASVRLPNGGETHP